MSSKIDIPIANDIKDKLSCDKTHRYSGANEFQISMSLAMNSDLYLTIVLGIN